MAATRAASAHALVTEIEELVDSHDTWYSRQAISLNAAEGALSPRAQRVLSSFLANRAVSGTVGRRSNRRLETLDAIETRLIDSAKQLFDCQFVEHRFLSCAMLNGYALHLLTEPGDRLLAIDIIDPTFKEVGFAGFRGLEVHYFPLNDVLNVDLDVFQAHVRRVRPKVIAVGQSWFLFPYPLKEMEQIASEVGARIIYDAAHVLGLAAGRQFQAPLAEGASVVTGSTSKTLSASLGGILIHNDPALAQRIDETWIGHLSGNNSARLAALAITLAEHLEYGSDFYAKVVENAQHLGRALADRGFRLYGDKLGFTRSHTILVDGRMLGDHEALATKMGQANIVFSPFTLAKYGHPEFRGFRIATTVPTAYGMGSAEMDRIADFFGRVVLDAEPPERVIPDVIELRQQFLTRQFCT